MLCLIFSNVYLTGPQRPPKTANLAPKRQRRDDEANDQTMIDYLGNLIGNVESGEIEEMGELEYIYFGGSDNEEDDSGDSDTDYEP